VRKPERAENERGLYGESLGAAKKRCTSALSAPRKPSLATPPKKARLAGGLLFVRSARRLLARRHHPLLPNAVLARLRHEEEGKHEAHRRHRNRIDQRVAEVARGREGRRSDERHQPATPAVADVIRDGHRRVA